MGHIVIAVFTAFALIGALGYGLYLSLVLVKSIESSVGKLAAYLVGTLLIVLVTFSTCLILNFIKMVGGKYVE